jgi:Sulfotransferase family
MRSLLDGAAGLAVFPRELHFFERSGLPVYYPLRPAQVVQRQASDFRDVVVSALRNEALDRNPYSDSPSFQGYDADRFARAWDADDRRADSLGDRYERYARALHISYTGRELPPDSRIVDKSTEYLEFVPILRHVFPGASFIHMIRNPYATWVSFRRYQLQTTHRYPPWTPLLRSVELSAYIAAHFSAVYERYALVRYEDLVTQPERTMRLVCDTVGVPFSDALLMPTSAEARWSGNSTRDTAFSGVTADARDLWMDEIASPEIAAANQLLPHFFWSQFSYEQLSIPGRVPAFRPLHREGLKTYVRNRAVLFA